MIEDHQQVSRLKHLAGVLDELIREGYARVSGNYAKGRQFE